MLLTLAALAALAVAVCLGPLQLVVRSGLRAVGGKGFVTRWQKAATWGLALGLVAAPLLVGATSGGQSAVSVAVLGLSVLLLTQDLAWRWLPLEWTLPLLALGLFASFLGGLALDSFSGAALGAGLLWSLQALFRRWRGVEAVGTGDIWLAAGVGAFVGPATTAWVLALAALSALAVEFLRKPFTKPGSRNRWGVAFGTHIIGVFLIIWAF